MIRHTLPQTINYHRYHGQNRQTEVSWAFTRDVVLTTFATIAADFCRGRRVLEKVHWFRIVLDEGMRHWFPDYDNISSLWTIGAITDTRSPQCPKQIDQAVSSRSLVVSRASVVPHWHPYTKHLG